MQQEQPLSKNAVALRVWWAMMWRFMLFTAPLAVIPDAMLQSLPLMVVLYLAMIALGAVLFRLVFNRRYRRFEIYFADPATGAKLPPRWYYVFCVLWSSGWRSMAVSLGVGIPLYGVALFWFAKQFQGDPNSSEALLMMMSFLLTASIVMIVLTTVLSIFIMRIVIDKRYRHFYTRVDHFPANAQQHSQQVVL